MCSSNQTSCPKIQLQSVFFFAVLFSVLQISAKGPSIDVLEVKSCVVSPLSDPKKSHFWSVISDGCSSDPSLALVAKTKDEDEAEGDGDHEEENEDTDGVETGRDGDVLLRHRVDRRGREAPERMEKRRDNVGAEDEIKPLRFSFILRPVYNDSMQFLHCSLHLCVSDSKRGEPMKETVKSDCEDGLRIPPLVSRSPRHQVHGQLTHYSFNSEHKTGAE